LFYAYQDEVLEAAKDKIEDEENEEFTESTIKM